MSDRSQGSGSPIHVPPEEASALGHSRVASGPAYTPYLAHSHGLQLIPSEEHSRHHPSVRTHVIGQPVTIPQAETLSGDLQRYHMADAAGTGVEDLRVSLSKYTFRPYLSRLSRYITAASAGVSPLLTRAQIGMIPEGSTFLPMFIDVGDFGDLSDAYTVMHWVLSGWANLASGPAHRSSPPARRRNTVTVMLLRLEASAAIPNLAFVTALVQHRHVNVHDSDPLARAFKGDGSWTHVAGHIEAGETDLEAAIRELGEEAGLTLADGRLYPVTASGDYVFLINHDVPIPGEPHPSEVYTGNPLVAPFIDACLPPPAQMAGPGYMYFRVRDLELFRTGWMDPIYSDDGVPLAYLFSNFFISRVCELFGLNLRGTHPYDQFRAFLLSKMN